MASEPQVSLLDKLMIVPIGARTITSALLRLITSPFSSGPKGKTYLKDVVYAALRTNLSIIGVATEQWLNSPTDSTYLDFTKKAGIEPDIETLDSGLKLCWLGSRSAEKVFLYMHGGGYSMSCSPGHWDWLLELQKELSKSVSFSVVVPVYTLAPKGQYPTQLKEAAETLASLLQQGKKPGDIILAGDSAGGHMALSLISHLLHPHSDVPKVDLSEPLVGAILISPWVKFGSDDDSVKRNETSDYVTASAANRWSSSFLGSKSLDNYNQPVLADVSWFSGIESKVKDIIIWGGGGEVLIDSIDAISKKLKEAHPTTEYVLEPGASHEEFIVERLLGYKEKADGTKVIESWLKSRL